MYGNCWIWALTTLINILLSGKANPWLSLALLAGAPLTVQKKKESGVCPIAIREVFLCLAARICYSPVHSHLIDCLIPHGQVGVGVKKWLYMPLLQPPTIDANDLCTILKLDMDNVYNDCIQSVFKES